MSDFPARSPLGHPAPHRFDPPATAAEPAAAPAADTETGATRPGHGRLPTLAETGSVVLAGLPVHSQRIRWQPRKVRDNTVGGSLRDMRPGLQGAGSEMQGDLATWFSARGQTSSQDDGSGRGGSGTAGRLRSLYPQDLRLLAPQAELLAPPTHMARHAVDLPAICSAHHGSHGASAMPAFLRETMESLVVDFVRDVADRLALLEQRAASGIAVSSGEALLPVREACDELLRVMRPIYSRYVPAPQLFADARSVLCQAQARLLHEVEGRGAGNASLRRVMHESVYPLLPIILMGSMPRPEPEPRRMAAA